MFKVFQITQNGESSSGLVLSEPSPDINKTVKRRNRVLQSCIACHEMRRKCDRKRPCSRCVDQGLGDQCVYQLEDPAYRQTGDEDEATRLRRRIVDLEKTVKVLRDRPMARDTLELQERDIKPLPRALRSTRARVEVDENRRNRQQPGPSQPMGPQSSAPTLAVPASHPGTGRPATHHGPYSYYPDTSMPPPQLTSVSHANDTYPSCCDPAPAPRTQIFNLTESQTVPPCGCAHTTFGRSEYLALQNKIGPLLSKLTNLQEHQGGQGSLCTSLIGLANLERSLRMATQATPPSPPQFMYTVCDDSYPHPASEGSPTSIPPSTSYGGSYHPPTSPHEPHSPAFATMLPYFLSTMVHHATSGFDHGTNHNNHDHTPQVGVTYNSSPTPRSYSNHDLDQSYDIKPFYTHSNYGLVAATSTL